MKSDPFDRIEVPPLIPASAPSVLEGSKAHRFVPDYALETQPGSSQSSAAGTSDYVEGAAVGAVGADGKLASVVQRSDAGTPTAYPTVLKVVNGTTSILINSTGITITTSSGKTCIIAFSAITQDMTVREITICDGATEKKMLVLGSAPY
jgi:hypothetical protein